MTLTGFVDQVGVPMSSMANLRQKEPPSCMASAEAIHSWAKVLELSPEEEHCLLLAAQACYAPRELRDFVFEELGLRGGES